MGWHWLVIAAVIVVMILGFLAPDWLAARRQKKRCEDTTALLRQGPSGDKARSIEEEWQSLLESQERRRMGAWEFFAWCDAVHTAHLEANPPTERFKIERAQNGRWFISVYAGIETSRAYGLMINMGHPFDQPSRVHAWTQIGGDYGFSFQEEALDFFREFILAPADLKFDGEGLDLPLNP